MKTKTYFWIFGVLIVLIVLFVVLQSNKVSSFETVKGYRGDITVYKSMSCGCCGVYYNYFKGKGNSNAQVVNAGSMESIKVQYGIPPEMKSCHTTVIGDYFIEGHIPLSAVEKLLQEKPDIKGIAMPGMPSGSPGMPGAKKGDFVIYAVNHDGSYEEFM